MLLIRPILTAAFVLCACSGVEAQSRHPDEAHATKAPAKKPPKSQAHPGNPAKGNTAGPRPVEEFMRMSPADREKALERLPPERQEKVRQQLQRYDEMPPERKAQLQRLWQLPPDKQQRVRSSMRDFSELPQDRRRAMRQQLQSMGTMSAEERSDYLKSPEFKQQYSPDEQEMMKNMSEILPPR
ncbi:MAG: DUF3106 domain-containing protein [Bryobacteraceae bacterium]